VIVIDEYASTVRIHEHNADAERILHLVQRIVREARPYGVHLVLATQRIDLETMSRSTRDHLDNTLLVLRPGAPVSETTVDMVFHGVVDREAARAAVQTLTPTNSYGHTVMGSRVGGVQDFRFTYRD
jgi:hypothetical protein